MGDVKARARKRAVGTRDRVMSYLTAVGEVRDANGMASTVLAEAVGYPGSSVAFAQLLSGMERSGLIRREIRGKRTYLITPAAPAAPPALGMSRRRAAAGPGGSAGPGTGAAARRAGDDLPAAGEGTQGLVVAAKGAGDFDYDELARRLLVQVVRRLAASPAADPAPRAEPAAAAAAGDRPLENTVASLERKLVNARSRQRKLTAENAKLREQLREARRNLALARERSGQGGVTGQLDSSEVVLLERLLSSAREKGGHEEQAGTG
ncbi:MAG TPA: hypothetical protein VKV80_15165 [Streptosporangiaceae bacterium]|nr:hypothetical protein [Streptosporangiaceae bacterium]